MKPLKYIIYVRKSTDREDRQVLSIESQTERLKEQFSDLKIIDVVDERKSAYLPGRPKLESVICRIEAGEADGIIAWHPNRLSRNEIDAGRITFALRNSFLKDLKFGSYYFDNSPEGIMMLQLALSQSQYESAKLSKDVKRGMLKKAQLGQPPGKAPLGYSNTFDSVHKGEKFIYPDPDRFKLVRKMWDMMLSGQYTVGKIADIASNQWGMRTVKTSRTGGVPISSGTLYKIFSNRLYAGEFWYDRKYYEGRYEKMITMDEFDKVQELLGRKGKPRFTKHKFPFTGFVRCTECGCLLTAERKTKVIKSTGEKREYTYYHCTRRRKDMDCSQRKNVLADDLKKQFELEIDKYTIIAEFRDLALKILRREHAIEVENRQQIHQTQHRAIEQTHKQLDRLLDMKLEDQIDSEEYERRRGRLKDQLAKQEEAINDTKHRAANWLELSEEVFEFATYAHIKFLKGDAEVKRSLMMKLGQNCFIKDGILDLQAKKWYTPIEEGYLPVLAEYERVRTENNGSPKAQELALAAINDNWRAHWDSNPGRRA